MLYRYPRGRWVASVLANDLLLATVLLTSGFLHSSSKLAIALSIAIPVVLAWGFFTLHFPSKVEIDEAGMSFFGYGRVHRFCWNDVRDLRVRRFLVRDRVLLRVLPSPPWRGRYWLLDSLDGFDALVRALESRAKGLRFHGETQ